MSNRSAISRFGRLQPADRRAVLEACWTLALTRLALKVLPFRMIAKWLARRVPAGEPPAGAVREAARLGWAVTAVSRSRVFHAVCLGQAIAAQTMLSRRRIPSVLHLGVANEDAKMIAHAWVTVGEFFVTGEAGHERFASVSTIP